MGQNTWEFINPAGIVQMESTKITPHPRTLEGKTVLLRWNGKQNGDNFLNRIGELLSTNIRCVKIIKSWEAVPESRNTSANMDLSKRLAAKLANLKPDIAIGAQGD